MKPLSRPQGWSNWSGTVRCEPNWCSEPVSLEEIQAEVLRAAEEGERLRVIGSGCSFAPLCWTDDNQMSLRRFTGIESADVQRSRVWVRAGTTLRHLNELLAERELALENGPSTDAPTIAGLIATGSHGSGTAFGNLASMVTGLRLVLADGSVRVCSREQQPELFDAARVSLGALGVVTHIELQCIDHYRLKVTSRRASFGETLARLTELRREHRNLELHWFPYAGVVRQRYADESREAPQPALSVATVRGLAYEQIMLRGMRTLARRSTQAAEYAGKLLAARLPTESCVLDAERAYALPRRTRVQQLEYALPLERAADILRQLERVIRALDFRVHIPIEIRFVRGDDAWLSPQYRRDSVCIALPAYGDRPYAAYFAAVTELFDRSEGRPHWGSAHDKTISDLRPLYPRLDDFCALRRQLDPHGLFLNPHIARLFGANLR
ncbi:D-arabinono-1,4-lactone oxidase [Solimonas soli]|uniref:D-arabinono-1,4-lactone oxidase n=1 Tax=Solimonas soli TaxID=413479 RepID=UPI000488EE21|nr:D-arabinono-1,4-lactone oxidase [Solimonas soli]